MTTLDALLAVCRADWRDQTAKLVYADALDEEGRAVEAALWRVLAEPHSDERRAQFQAACEADDPARAELIRVQTEMEPLVKALHGGGAPVGTTARVMRLRETETELFQRHHARWLGVQMDSVAYAGLWVRGFVEGVRCMWEVVRDHLDTLRERHPIRAVRLTTPVVLDSFYHRQHANEYVTGVAGEVVRISEVELAQASRQPESEGLQSIALARRWPGITFTLDPPRRGEIAFNGNGDPIGVHLGDGRVANQGVAREFNDATIASLGVLPQFTRSPRVADPRSIIRGPV